MSKKKTVGSAPEAVMDMNQFRTWLGLSDRLAVNDSKNQISLQ